MVFYSVQNVLDIFPIVTNFMLLLTSWEAFMQCEYFISFIFFFETFVSMLFHICKAFDVCFGLTFWAWHDFDHFFATSLVWLAIVYLIQFPRIARIGKDCLVMPGVWLKMLCYLLGMLAIAVLLAISDDGFLLSCFAGFAFLVLFCYLVGYSIYSYSRGGQAGHWLPPYRWHHLLPATLLLTYATVLFTVQESAPGYYWAIHAAWHALAALGWCYLLQSSPLGRVKVK